MMSRKRFLFWWVLATAVAWMPTFYLITEVLSVSWSASLTAQSRAAYIGGLTAMGAAIGLAQGLVLSRVWQGGLYWLPATAGGTLLGAIAGELCYQTELFSHRGWLNAMLIIAPAVALAQWWVVRRADPRFFWLFFKLTGLVAAGIGGLFVYLPLYGLIGQGIDRTLGGLAASGGVGAVVGLLTGFLLVRVVWSGNAEHFPGPVEKQLGAVTPAAIGDWRGALVAWSAWLVVCATMLGGIYRLDAAANEPPPRLPADVAVVVEPFTLPGDAGRVEMVYVPAGTFAMGSNDNQSDERPYHRLYLDAFWIDRLEVSNERYAACVGAGVCTPPDAGISGRYVSEFADPEAANLPVSNITWGDAATYCQWRGGRLPTEAEWEKAARGTDGRLYPWGNTFYAAWVNYCDARCSGEHADLRHDDGYTNAAPVDAFAGGASPYGALNMLGNVSEWVADWYDGGIYSRGDHNANPQGPDEGKTRVYRGGSSRDDLRFMRLSARYHELVPDYTAYWIGVRCALSSE